VLFKDYKDEQLVAMYGMLTGTASTGIVLLRELDPEFETPVSDNLVYQNFPAIIFGLPLMLIAAQAPENPVGTLLIAVAFFTVLNIILFRKQIMGIFKK
jgi:ESS family glutamate:Na+ symporter